MQEVTNFPVTNVMRILMTSALASALLLAQRPERPERGTPPDPQTMIQMRVARLTTLLSLTDDQKTKATTIFSEAFAASQNARTAMQTAREALSTAIKSNAATTIDQTSVTIGSLTAQLTAIDAKADAAFYSLLTAAQKAQYDERPAHGGGGPRGGFGPPR